MSVKEKHVLGLSGGRDSAALAVYMRQHHPDIEIEYFFTDTGKELPEVYEYLGRLEGFLGKPILRLNPDRDFDFWLKQYNDFLPSPKTRWCTRDLKLRPFEHWVRPMLKDGIKIYSYVAIRGDEEYREGYSSKHENLIVKLPFKEAGIDKAGVLEILDGAGLGLPKYYSWRTRSGCTFCFYQQKIEWVRLMEQHPEAFEEAKAYEKILLTMALLLLGVKGNLWESFLGRSACSKSRRIMSSVWPSKRAKPNLTPYAQIVNHWILMIFMGRLKCALLAISKSVVFLTFQGIDS